MTENSKDLELFHYGVKGMKWGVRRKSGSDGGGSTEKKGVRGKLASVKKAASDQIKDAQVRKNERTIQGLKSANSSKPDLQSIHDAFKYGKEVTVEDMLRSGGRTKAVNNKISSLTAQNERIRSGKEGALDILTTTGNVTLNDVLER